MQDQTALRDYLLGEFERRKLKNSSYSLRSFAGNIEVHPAALSEFLRGKRVFSLKIAKRILAKIADGPDIQETILAKFEGQNSSINRDKNLARAVDTKHR